MAQNQRIVDIGGFEATQALTTTESQISGHLDKLESGKLTSGGKDYMEHAHHAGMDAPVLAAFRWLDGSPRLGDVVRHALTLSLNLITFCSFQVIDLFIVHIVERRPVFRLGISKRLTIRIDSNKLHLICCNFLW